MRLQVILHGGPHEGTMISLSQHEGDWPMQLRVASGDDSDEVVKADIYQRHDVDTEGVIFMGSYKWTHHLLCARTLVDRWL